MIPASPELARTKATSREGTLTRAGRDQGEMEKERQREKKEKEKMVSPPRFGARLLSRLGATGTIVTFARDGYKLISRMIGPNPALYTDRPLRSYDLFITTHDSWLTSWLYDFHDHCTYLWFMTHSEGFPFSLRSHPTSVAPYASLSVLILVVVRSDVILWSWICSGFVICFRIQHYGVLHPWGFTLNCSCRFTSISHSRYCLINLLAAIIREAPLSSAPTAQQVNIHTRPNAVMQSNVIPLLIVYNLMLLVSLGLRNELSNAVYQLSVLVLSSAQSLWLWPFPFPLTHKSSSSFDVAWIEVSFSTGGGTFEPAGFDPPSLAYAIAPVPNIVPSALYD